MATPDTLGTMNSRAMRVLVETPRYRIVGTLVLPRDGYRSRLSDFLNSSDREFISLTDVSMQALDTEGRAGEPVEHEFITISRQHIVLATTVDGGAVSV
ncbi:MAG: hypothetical protein QOE65_2933 [Solirubrobacteraceae bacterium]|jgi:hypothetical protein|nr:hypothetical protein [Solirubrobacteraceae bacterium]